MAEDSKSDDNSYTLPRRNKGSIEPASSGSAPLVAPITNDESVEPSAGAEISSITHTGQPRSQHQQFMYALSTSGKSLSEIQDTWHKYYAGLPDAQKHEVWREFYESNNRAIKQNEEQPARAHQTLAIPQSKPVETSKHHTQLRHKTPKHLKYHVKKAKRSALKPILFGLSMGCLTLFILLLGFFNERFIAPLITPSRNVSSTPIIVDPNATGANPDDLRVIIPKINVEVPVVYDEPSVDEGAIQKALERGVIHYATTSKPGETGNTVIFGHSSNNILNKGKYKFAFVLLSRLEVNDTFILTHGGKRYVYKVSDKRIVKPTDFSVLAANTATPTATLITCDPPGTSLNRLAVVGEQITPDPATAVASTAANAGHSQPEILPGNAPSLWKRITGWFSS